MRLGRPVMNILTRGGSSLDERSAWIPVLGSWTSSRDFDVIAPYRFRTWLAEHNAARAEERTQAREDKDQKGGA